MGAPASGQAGPGGPGLTPPSSVRPPRAAGGAARAGPAWLGRVGHATTHSARAPSGRRTTITHTPPISRSSHTPPAAHVQVGADGPARCYCCSAPGQPRACTAVWVLDRTTSAGGGPSVGQVLCSPPTRTGLGPARQLRDSDQDRGPGPGSRFGQRPPPRHLQHKVMLERYIMCRSHGPRDPVFPCIWCKPQLVATHASILRVASPVLSTPSFSAGRLFLTPKSSSHPRLRSLAVVDYGLSRKVLWRLSSPSRI